MSVFITRHLCSLSALALLLAAPVAHAQLMFFPNDTTFDASNVVPPPGTVVTGYANFDDYINSANPTNPTIQIVTGADINALEVHNSSLINMSGGNVGNGSFGTRLLAEDTSTVNISGGHVFDLDVQGAATVNFRGGTIDDAITTHDTTTVNMSGGSVGFALLINDTSTFNLSGGLLPDNVFVQDSSLFNIFGTGLGSTLLDPNFEGFYSEYALSGRLQDNTDLAGRIFFVQNGSGAGFTLNAAASTVPEPGAFATLVGACGCAGGLVLRRKQRISR